MSLKTIPPSIKINAGILLGRVQALLPRPCKTEMQSDKTEQQTDFFVASDRFWVCSLCFTKIPFNHTEFPLSLQSS